MTMHSMFNGLMILLASSIVPGFKVYGMGPAFWGAVVLAILGMDDEYGTMEQIDRIGRGVRDFQRLELQHCGHSPHRDQPEAVLAAVADFLA